MKVNIDGILDYVLPQFKWLWLPHEETSFYLSGGRGSSKSTALIQRMIWLSFGKDGNNILIIRGTYSSHKDTTFQEFTDWISMFDMDNFSKYLNLHLK